jgi:hypothetical protein
MPELTSPSSSRTIASPPKKRGRLGGKLFNILLLIAVLATIALFVRAEQQRRSVASELEKASAELEQIRRSTQGSGAEKAKEVLEKVRHHMDVPQDPEPTVATIVDVEKLKAANEFYKNAANGDHLIITQSRAILYSATRDRILDVVPVRVDSTASPAAAPPGGPPAGTPNVTPPPPR